GTALHRALCSAARCSAEKMWYLQLRTRDGKELIIAQPVHIGVKLWELRCSDHAPAAHQKRRAHFFVTMLARVQIEHELDKSSLQPRARAGKTNETAPTQFRRAFEIRQLEGR